MTLKQGWSIEELIKVVEESQRVIKDRDPSLITGPDYARMAGCSHKTARGRLIRLRDAGLAEPGHTFERENVHGERITVKGWKLNVEEIQKWRNIADRA